MRWPFSRSRLISISFRPAVAPRRLQRIGAAANDYRRFCRRMAVDERAGARRRARRDLARLAEDAR